MTFVLKEQTAKFLKQVYRKIYFVMLRKKSYEYPVVNFTADIFLVIVKYGFVNVRTARLIKNFLKITFKVMCRRIVNVIRISSAVYIIKNKNLEICSCQHQLGKIKISKRAWESVEKSDRGKKL